MERKRERERQKKGRDREIDEERYRECWLYRYTERI